MYPIHVSLCCKFKGMTCTSQPSRVIFDRLAKKQQRSSSLQGPRRKKPRISCLLSLSLSHSHSLFERLSSARALSPSQRCPHSVTVSATSGLAASLYFGHRGSDSEVTTTTATVKQSSQTQIRSICAIVFSLLLPHHLRQAHDEGEGLRKTVSDRHTSRVV